MNFEHYHQELEKALSLEKIMSLLESEDDIGVVLRLHLIIEKYLEAWCICATNNSKFFDGFGENITLTFAAKAQLAKNFGLSDLSFNGIKRFNKIRNIRSHQINNWEITDAEIDSLKSLASKERDVGSPPFINHGIKIAGVKEIYFYDKESTNRDKLIMLAVSILSRMTSEVEKKQTSS